MDPGRPIQLVSFTTPESIEVTTEGIQFLQSLGEPLGIVCVAGPPSAGKTTLCNHLLDRPYALRTEPTAGIWAWSETLKVTQRDEKGEEKEIQLLVLDSESYLHESGRQLFVLSLLLSSHLVLISKEPLSNEYFESLALVTELPELIQIQKKQDSRALLSAYLPRVTWVISGLELKQGEPGNIVLERALTKTAPDQNNTNATKAAIKQFLKKRHGFPLSAPVEGAFSISELGKEDCNPNYFAHLNSISEHLKRTTEAKKILSKNVSGGVLCNMLQAYVQRFSKRAPAVVLAAFERGVASEARRNKEKLLSMYIDQMSLIEDELPCEEDQLWKEHLTASKRFLSDFDALMMYVFDQEEVQEERNSFVTRMETYFEDMKENNLKQSETHCRELFKSLFEGVRQEELSYLEDGTALISEVETKLLGAIQSYQDNASGPAAEKVFAEDVAFLVPHMCALFRELQSHFESDSASAQKELKTLNKQLDELRNSEKKLKEQLEETNRSYEKQQELRDKQVSDLQANIHTKIHQAKSTIRAQNREIQGLKMELEQSLKEREMMIEAEKDMYEKKIADLDTRVYKLSLDNSKYERIIDDLREEQEKQIGEKNEQINSLSRKLKLMESQSEQSPRQDASLLRSFKEYLDDIFHRFSKEEISNKKYLTQLDRVYELQNELNELKLREQEEKNGLVDDYEEKLHGLKREKDTESKSFAEQVQQQKEELSKTFESVTEDLEKQKKIYTEREEQIKRLMDEKNELGNELAKREQQLADQYEVIDAHRKEVDTLRISIDDRDSQINRLKIENAEEKDDNDILIELMAMAVDTLSRKRSLSTIPISRIQNSDNRSKIGRMLKKYGIPIS